MDEQEWGVSAFWNLLNHIFYLEVRTKATTVAMCVHLTEKYWGKNTQAWLLRFLKKSVFGLIWRTLTDGESERFSWSVLVVQC